jgi:4-amino-4-deoxy-L-arabinose transferase-like glycosyltransferase
MPHVWCGIDPLTGRHSGPSGTHRLLVSQSRGKLTGRLPALIILAGLFLRLYFFVGLVSGDPQDDGVYYQNAVALAERGPDYLAKYRDLPADFLANPIDQFHFRPLTTYPIAFAFRLFGAGEGSAVLWSLLCSVLSMYVVYRLSTGLGGQVAGIFSVFLLAVYPLDVIMATRILSDLPLGFFCGLGLWGVMVARGSGGHHKMIAVAAGGAFGLGYLTNPRALLVLGIVILLLLACRDGVSRLTAVRVFAGFFLVFLAEALPYWWTTGDPFLSLRIHNGANTFKYLNEPTAAWRIGILDVHFTNGRPFQLLQAVFNVRSAPVNLFGLYFFLFAAASALALLRRQHVYVVLLSIALFLFLEFGFVGLRISPGNDALEYWMVFKQERFLTILTIPLVALSGWMLAVTAARHRLAAAAVLVLVAGTSISAIAKTSATYRDTLTDLRSIAGDVLERSDRTFYTDPWAEIHLRIFTQYRATNMRSLNRNDIPPTDPRACLILGGSRGAELQAGYVESVLPDWARALLPGNAAAEGWVPVRTITGTRTALRQHDLHIYCRS